MTVTVVAGFDRATVESCFDPEGAVWTPVKLRGEFSTVEWRAPDTTVPSQVVRLADDVVGVIERLPGPERMAVVRIGGADGRVATDRLTLPAFDSLESLVAEAIREGMSFPAVRSYLERIGFDVSGHEPPTEAVRRERPLNAARARVTRLEYADQL